MKKEYDVLIVGGGLAGLSLAALSGHQGLSIACFDRNTPANALKEPFDGRTTAISWASQKVLSAAGVWSLLEKEACPILDIQILDGDSPVLLEFFAHEVNNRAFGWIVENRRLRAMLYTTLEKQSNVDFIAPVTLADFKTTEDYAEVISDTGQSYRGKLLIGADGKNSIVRAFLDIPTRGWSYKQSAIVCVAEHDNPHENIAVEHFRPEGPFAILPMADNPETGAYRSSIVWTEHGQAANSALQYEEDIFNAALTARAPDFYGQMRLAGQRFFYPLGLKHAHNYTGQRTALVAEAAHAMHPIAGQGLNMGLRDIAVLSDLICQAHQSKSDIGAPDLLCGYQRKRRADNMGMMAATDGLNKLFSNNLPPVKFARTLGVRAVSRFKPAKNFFMKQAMGAAGLLPDLISQKD